MCRRLPRPPLEGAWVACVIKRAVAVATPKHLRVSVTSKSEQQTQSSRKEERKKNIETELTDPSPR
jgi:hypothetical protein